MFLDFAAFKDASEFSAQEGIIEKSLIEMKKLATQLLNITTGEKKHNLSSFLLPKPTKEQQILILKSITSGFIDQIALKVDTHTNNSKRIPYTTQKNLDSSLYPEDYKSSTNNLEHVFIHPSSYFFRRCPPQFIAYQNLNFITRPSLFNITEIRTE